jgi:hypothetical protein
MALLDVLAFRIYYSLFLAGTDRTWEEEALSSLWKRSRFEGTPVLIATSPNSPEAREFLRRA